MVLRAEQTYVSQTLDRDDPFNDNSLRSKETFQTDVTAYLFVYVAKSSINGNGTHWFNSRKKSVNFLFAYG